MKWLQNSSPPDQPTYQYTSRVWKKWIWILALGSTLKAWRGRFFSGWCTPERKGLIKFSASRSSSNSSSWSLWSCSCVLQECQVSFLDIHVTTWTLEIPFSVGQKWSALRIEQPMKELTLSMPKELPLMARSCSSRLLFRSRSCIKYLSIQASSDICRWYWQCLWRC